MKKLLPLLKISIDNLYNKKAFLNLINLKYFHLNTDVFTQAIIVKLKKKKSPLLMLKKSMNKIKIYLDYNVKKQVLLNNMHKLYNYSKLSLKYLPSDLLRTRKKTTNTDWLQSMFDRIFPYAFMPKYNNPYIKRYKVTNILNTIKYKKMLGIRIEANGRLTRRNTAARSKSILRYKGNLRDVNKYWNRKESIMKNMYALLLRNSQRPNTQYVFKSSRRRIGAFGIKTWISAK